MKCPPIYIGDTRYHQPFGGFVSYPTDSRIVTIEKLWNSLLWYWLPSNPGRVPENERQDSYYHIGAGHIREREPNMDKNIISYKSSDKRSEPPSSEIY